MWRELKNNNLKITHEEYNVEWSWELIWFLYYFSSFTLFSYTTIFKPPLLYCYYKISLLVDTFWTLSTIFIIGFIGKRHSVNLPYLYYHLFAIRQSILKFLQFSREITMISLLSYNDNTCKHLLCFHDKSRTSTSI